MCRQFCLLGAFPDINSIHIYNDMHALYGRAIDAKGKKVTEIMAMTPQVLAGFFGSAPAAVYGSEWIAKNSQDLKLIEDLYEIGQYLQNKRINGNLFAIVSVRPSKEGYCQMHRVLITNKHRTTVARELPSCVIAALALGALSRK